MATRYSHVGAVGYVADLQTARSQDWKLAVTSGSVASAEDWPLRFHKDMCVRSEDVSLLFFLPLSRPRVQRYGYAVIDGKVQSALDVCISLCADDPRELLLDGTGPLPTLTRKVGRTDK
jgi:hypothetical protein